MTDETKTINPLFLQLIISLQSAAWYQMGKTISPVSGKIERDLIQAKVSIDLLNMLQEKTKGNLLEEEQKIIDSTVYNLQMNYIDELEKDKKEPKAEDDISSTEKASEENDENSGTDSPEDK
ncbi:MAG: DUF1844 domain-containing protein [candidate division Zixibacteria bacterium]